MGKTAARASQNERDGAELADDFLAYIKAKKGQYVRDTDGSLHVILDGRRTPLKCTRNDEALNRLMLEACDVSTISSAAQIAIQRVLVEAAQKAGRLKMRKFSGMSQDKKRLYIPLDNGSLLLITKRRPMIDTNGENEDGLWVEHPVGNPFGWSEERAAIGLAHFERLLVRTQACQEPAMQWFVAMSEGLFPYVRDLCSGRFVIVHVGDSQSGKTTGAHRFTLLHGLGDVKGDYSDAALGNIGDIGLLAMDNKEQRNLTPGYINFLLFLSTGGERGRCQKDGRLRSAQDGRPVGIVTSIEGIGVKTELRKRCVDVPYVVKGEKLNRGPIEREILGHRNSILSAIAEVLTWFFGFYSDGPLPAPNPLPDFEEHYTALCNLLRAYEMVAGKPDGWSEQIIQSWDKLLTERDTEEDILEHPLQRVLRERAKDDPDLGSVLISYEGKTGTLYVADCGALLTKLQGLGLPDRIAIPDTPGGLGKRLRTTDFRAFQVLDQERAPEIAILKRTHNRRPIGFFVEDDGSCG